MLLAALLVRRLLIRYIGNDVNGLNSLYTSIIGMLSVAELGVGSAIVFSMYSPIVQGNKEKVAALYCLYKKIYRIIGVVITIGGLVVTPFLPLLIEDYQTLNVNVYGTFLLTLCSVVMTYLYSAKTSLIEAYKDNYITTGIISVSRVLRYALQIAAILIWRSYTVFLVCQIIETVLVWCLTEIAVKQKHPDIIKMRETVDQETKDQVGRNVKAMFMHKIGSILVKSTDSMIISAFIGVVALGMFSNYMALAIVVAGMLGLFFIPLTSVIGHMCVEETPGKAKEYFDHFYCLNYILGFVFFLGYYAVIDHLVALLFGSGLGLSRAVVFIITLNQFISSMRSTSNLFREASGTFYNDRWKPIAEGITNLVLSLLFVFLFKEEYRIVGVIAATIITTILICHVVEPYVVFCHVFHQKPYRFYLKNYAYIGLFAICLFAMKWVIQAFDNHWIGILCNGLLSVVISAAVLGFLAIVDKSFRKEVCVIMKAIPAWTKKIFHPD